MFSFDVTDVAEDALPLAMRWGGREALVHDEPIRHENYRYAVLKYTLRGTGTYRSDRERWRIEPGMVIWASARCESEMIADRGVELVNQVVMVFGTELRQVMADLFPTPVGAVMAAEPDRVGRVMEMILEEGRHPGPYREENCAAMARVLLHRMGEAVWADRHAGVLSHQSYQRCRQYIAEHYQTLNTLNDVAQACGLTVPYVCRLFDQFGDISAYEYLTRLKLNHAERLLISVARPAVKEVAITVGYRDARLFTRNFKALFGVNPRDYRRSHA